MRWAAALADERDLPAGAADPRRVDAGQRRGRARSRSASGCRRRTAGERIGARPCASGEAGKPASRSPRRRAGGGGWRPCRPARLADHRGEAAVAHAFLHHRQHLRIVAALGEEQAVRRQPRLREAGREQIAPRHRPEHLAFRPRRRAKRAASAARNRVAAASSPGATARRRRLVQPQAQPAAGQPGVHLREPEGQARPRPRPAAAALDGADLGAQGGEARSLAKQRACDSDFFVHLMFRPLSARVKFSGLTRPARGF